jgi:hypothetical protein
VLATDGAWIEFDLGSSYPVRGLTLQGNGDDTAPASVRLLWSLAPGDEWQILDTVEPVSTYEVMLLAEPNEVDGLNCLHAAPQRDSDRRLWCLQDSSGRVC